MTAGAAWTTLDHSLEPVALMVTLIERLCRSVKHEAAYLVDLADHFHARRVIDDWMTFSSAERPYSAPGGVTPNEPYGLTKQGQMAA